MHLCILLLVGHSRFWILNPKFHIGRDGWQSSSPCPEFEPLRDSVEQAMIQTTNRCETAVGLECIDMPTTPQDKAKFVPRGKASKSALSHPFRVSGDATTERIVTKQL